MENDELSSLVQFIIFSQQSTSTMWPDLIQKAKDGGLDAIETYILWNAHEPQRRQEHICATKSHVS
ncbi:hypothetical protein WN943_027139 [Citrus x changshan-huyou]